MALMAMDVYGATIHGTIYDFSLIKVKNIIIEINTQPIQRQISIDGSYSFDVPAGSYNITAKTTDNEVLVVESIKITTAGDYTLDLITLIDINEEEFNESDLGLIDEVNGDIVKNNNILWILLIIVVLIVAGFFLYKYKKKPKKEDVKEDIEEGGLPDKVLEIIKKEDGRISQKELRKLFPYSEAKISLVITELEAKGKIQKIKKGRTNVILIKK